MKLEVEREVLNTILASLGQSREYYYDKKDKRTGDWLQSIRIKLIEQAQILEDYFTPA